MDLILPSAQTVEKLSYGDPLFRMPPSGTGGYIPQTANKQYVAEVAGMLPMGAPASKGVTRAANATADALVREITRNPLATAPAALEAAARMSPLPRIVPTDVAKNIDMPTILPKSNEFVNAVENTPGAQIVPEGLLMRVQRSQKPEQAGMESVRTGVFYLPEGAAQAKHYSGAKSTYGGSEKIAGETLYKNPLFVKGATGGKAPEAAYDQIMGKDAYKNMRQEVVNALGFGFTKPQEKLDSIQSILQKYNDMDSGDAYDMAYYIISNSKEGNTLPYAVQENIVANAVRNAGYDAVLGYSQKKTGDKFISEVFDVREATYPTKQGDFTLMPQFEDLLRRRSLLD